MGIDIPLSLQACMRRPPPGVISLATVSHIDFPHHGFHHISPSVSSQPTHKNKATARCLADI